MGPRTRRLASVAALFAWAACDGPPSRAVVACNGEAVLCDRRYDEVVYPTTHNAMSAADEGWRLPNQPHGITTQLADGIRALMLDTDYFEGDAWLCHGFCQLGRTPLVDGFAEVSRFLDQHPAEVVTLILESYVTPDDTAMAMQASGLGRRLHAQARGDPWPTLRDLIVRDERVVVFTDSGGGALPWYHDEWAWAWETSYAASELAELSCAATRGAPSNPLFVLNHFLTRPFASPDLAELANHAPVLLGHARRCMTESGRLPNFVAVDFYTIGDLFEVVAALNGVAAR